MAASGQFRKLDLTTLGTVTLDGRTRKHARGAHRIRRMRFDLKQPCPNCPFRKDCLPGWLGETRAEEIAEALLGSPGKTFACHQTTHFDEEGEHEQHLDEQHCAGAMILIEAVGCPNQMLQIAERFELRDPETINPEAKQLVFDDRESFVGHHSVRPVRPTRSSKT